MDKKEQARLRMRKMRERNKGSVTPDDNVTQDVTLIFPPSKFLSPEVDRQVQENVINTMRTMSSARLSEFRGLANTFTPNKVRNQG